MTGQHCYFKQQKVLCLNHAHLTLLLLPDLSLCFGFSVLNQEDGRMTYLSLSEALPAAPKKGHAFRRNLRLSRGMRMPHTNSPGHTNSPSQLTWNAGTSAASALTLPGHRCFNGTGEQHTEGVTRCSWAPRASGRGHLPGHAQMAVNVFKILGKKRNILK